MEKIKVSFLIDKEVVKKKAFNICESPEEYNEVVDVIDINDELVRDVTREEPGEKADSANDMVSIFAMGALISKNSDLALSKRAMKFNEEHKDDSSKEEKFISLLKKILSEK